MSKVLVSGGLVPTTKDTLLDARTRVATFSEIANIENPARFMVITVEDTGKKYEVKKLTSKIIGGIVVENSTIDINDPEALLDLGLAEELRAEDEKVRQENETKRIEAESLRKTAEDSRSSNERSRISAESAREASEKNRANAEEVRNANEQTRNSNETKRQSQESTRQSQESARQVNESARNSNEATRKTAETERNTEETSRRTSELARKEAENTRSKNEQSRTVAENTRSSAEDRRVASEETRNANEKARINAELSREQAEGNRASTFNTLKGQMQTTVQEGQSAIAATEKATSDAQKVVDEYDTKVLQQDSKLSELGSLLNSKTEATTEINKICNIKTGEITIHNSFSIQKLEISDNAEKIVMPSYWGSNSLGNYDGAAFFDKNMNHLGYAQGILGATWSVSLTEIPLGMIPSGTKYVVTTSNEFKDSVGYCEQSENVAKELGELKEKIKNIENDLESDIKNYIEHNYTLPTYQDEALGKNLFNKNGDIYSGFVYADGNSSSGKQWDEVPLYTSGYFATTYPLVVEGGKELTVSPTTNDAIYIAEYAADGSFVKSTKSLAPSTTIKLDLNTRYIRVPFVYTALNKLQVEYGSKATSYEEYKSKKVISLDDLPKEVTDVVRTDDVEKVVGEQLKEQSYQGEIVLPKTLYNMVGRKSVLYISQFCKGSENVDIKLSATGAENVYGNSIVFQPQTSGVTYWSYIHLINGARIVSSQGATINNIAAPSTNKNVKIMTIGDSLTDLGYYQSHLTRLLAENKVSCKWIGTQHRGDYEDVSFEAKSGGNLSYIATDYNVAKIIEVSVISVPPSTGYGSTEYTDGNGNKWRVNGHILTESNGVYSGKIRLVKYERDPNYEGGDAGDITGSNLPSSGVLTKSNSGDGDGIIEYNLISTASENPLWNPQIKEVDWNYYFTTWGLDVPNIVILQFGYNEVEGMSNTNSEGVQIAASRLKYVIDKLHEQYPNVKIIVGLEIYGANSVGYYNKFYNSAYPRKFAQLSLYQEWMKAFENYSHVVFAPIYARMDDVRGYGLMTEIAVNDNVYENPMKETVRVDGFDGVHPPFDYGQKEIAMTYEPIIISMI